jgi:hypothetical protein
LLISAILARALTEPLLREALPEVMRIVREIGMDLSGTIVSLDGVYDCRVNRKAIFNRDMVPNINPIRAAESSRSEAVVLLELTRFGGHLST